MSMLPKLQSTYKYEMILPVLGKKFRYRPYLVKEEKALLMANEGGSRKGMVQAMMDILDACVEGLDSSKLAMADMEYAFANVRGRSAGEIVDIEVACQSCEQPVALQVNLLDVKAETPEEVSNSFKIDTGTDEWVVTLRWPTFEVVGEAVDEEDSEVSTAFRIMADMLDTLRTSEQLYRFDEVPLQERLDFLDSLSSEQMKPIRDHMNSMPQAKIDLDFECPHCQSHNEQALKGLQNFFG